MVEWLGSPSEVRKMGGGGARNGGLLAYSLASVTALVRVPIPDASCLGPKNE